MNATKCSANWSVAIPDCHLQVSRDCTSSSKNLPHPHRLKLVVIYISRHNIEMIVSTKPIQIAGHMTTVLAMTFNLAISGRDKKYFDVTLRNLWTWRWESFGHDVEKSFNVTLRLLYFYYWWRAILPPTQVLEIHPLLWPLFCTDYLDILVLFFLCVTKGLNTAH